MGLLPTKIVNPIPSYLAESAELCGIEKVPHILDDVLALLGRLLRLARQEQGTGRGYLDTHTVKTQESLRC